MSNTALELKPLHEKFAQFFLRHGNAPRAAAQAGITRKYVKRAATLMLARPEIRFRIDEIRAQQYARLRITPDQTLAKIAAIAHANPDELISHRVHCCRHCYGLSHRHQRTAGEYERDLLAYQRKVDLHAAEKLPTPAEFDEMGGIGYDKRRPPHADCPECWGEGETEVKVADTRKLSPEARALLAGVKITKDGLEVKMHSQLDALKLLLQHQGLLVERSQVDVGGTVTVQHELSQREIARRIAFALTLGLNQPEAVGVAEPVKATTGEPA